jgi:hypothetical protein
MLENRQKSYGNRYKQSKFKVRLNKLKLFYAIIGILVISEIVLGVLWALGY